MLTALPATVRSSTTTLKAHCVQVLHSSVVEQVAMMRLVRTVSAVFVFIIQSYHEVLSSALICGLTCNRASSSVSICWGVLNLFSVAFAVIGGTILNLDKLIWNVPYPPVPECQGLLTQVCLIGNWCISDFSAVCSACLNM